MARSPETAESIDPTEPTVADLSAQLESLKADMVAITETLTALGKAKGQQVKYAALDEAEYLRRRGEEKVADLQDRANVMHAQAHQLVRDNPSAALGIAAGAGFLFGIIMSRR